MEEQSESCINISLDALSDIRRYQYSPTELSSNPNAETK